VVTNKVEVDNELVSKFSFYLPINNIHDYTGGKSKATLIHGMEAVIISMRTVPYCFSKNVHDLHALEEGTDLCPAIKRFHKVVGTAIKSNNTKQAKQVTYQFPESMTCNNNHWNNSSGDLKLWNILCFLLVKAGKNVDGRKMTQVMPFIFWSLLIDGKTCHLETKASLHGLNKITKAMKHMSNMNIGSI
jgi:hypothetical protein